MATEKQLGALAKARAARKKKKPCVGCATKKRKKNPVKKRATVDRYLVFTKNASGKRYYLQKKANKWIWDTKVPAGMPKNIAEKNGRCQGRKLPCNYAVYMEKKR